MKNSITASIISASSHVVVGGNIQVDGTISASSHIQGDNIFGNSIASTGNITASGNISASHDITASNLSLDGFPDVSYSLAAITAGGDNLGNHQATRDLNLRRFSIIDAKNVESDTIQTGEVTITGNSTFHSGYTIDNNSECSSIW